MGAHLDTPYSYLAMTKRSQYVDKHEHADQEGRRTRIRPTGRKYLFVYPMVKKRPWYRLSLEERQKAMDEHIRVGHEFPRVKINTSYSFGLDDQEFVVAFETDYPSDFLDLVERLRGGEASAYTERETPIFTCVAGSIAEVSGAARVTVASARALTGAERMLAACRRRARPTPRRSGSCARPAAAWRDYRTLREQYPILTLAKTPELCTRRSR